MSGEEITMSRSVIVPRPDQDEVRHIPLNESELGQFRSLVRWLTIFGWINIGLSVLDLLNLFASKNLAPVLSALVKIFLGTWSLEAARAFRKVADTDESDQRYLVLAFGKLHLLFLVQAILVIVGLALTTALALVGLLVYLSHR